MILRISALLSLTLTLVVTSVAASDQPYGQIFVGYNGPESSVTTYFHDEQSFRTSWVADSLQPAEVETVLSKVHFDTQVLVVSAVGERKAVTSAQLGGVQRYGNALSVLVLIGVADTHCTGPRPVSYPFVIGVVAKPEAFNGVPNYFHQNFPDECKAVHSGSPTLARPNNSFKPNPLRGSA